VTEASVGRLVGVVACVLLAALAVFFAAVAVWSGEWDVLISDLALLTAAGFGLVVLTCEPRTDT
jgi:hypothetical protein